MSAIRVVLFELRGMLKQIVRETLTREPDIAVVEVEDEAALARTAASADVVIVGGIGDERPPITERLLSEQGDVRVLSVSETAREAYLWKLEPHGVPLGELSPESLVAAVRQARTRRP